MSRKERWIEIMITSYFIVSLSTLVAAGVFLVIENVF
jgi:hypothetical protein